jgi:hypothetical protein
MAIDEHKNYGNTNCKNGNDIHANALERGVPKRNGGVRLV